MVIGHHGRHGHGDHCDYGGHGGHVGGRGGHGGQGGQADMEFVTTSKSGTCVNFSRINTKNYPFCEVCQIQA